MIVAEIGIAYGYNFNKRKELIRLAKENGASAVKSQLYNAEDDRDKPYYQESKAGELTFEQAKELFDYGESIGIEMFYSVFHPRYVEWCERIGVKRYKIACEMRLHETIDAVLVTNKPIIISYTDGDSAENKYIDSFVDVDNCKWLYCVPSYPATEFNFKNVDFDLDGWSDHAIGIDVAKIAFARGAEIVEKHFTDDIHDGQVDSPWSMNSEMLRELARWEKVCKEVIG